MQWAIEWSILVDRGDAARQERVLKALPHVCRQLTSQSGQFFALGAPSLLRPASRLACFAQFEIDCAVGTNSRATSSGVRPDRTRSTIRRLNSGGDTPR